MSLQKLLLRAVVFRTHNHHRSERVNQRLAVRVQYQAIGHRTSEADDGLERERRRHGKQHLRICLKEGPRRRHKEVRGSEDRLLIRASERSGQSSGEKTPSVSVRRRQERHSREMATGSSEVFHRLKNNSLGSLAHFHTSNRTRPSRLRVHPAASCSILQPV